MEPVGDLAGIWEACAPLVNMFRHTAVHWIPGHRLIQSNEVADAQAKKSAGNRLEPSRWDGVDFGIGGAQGAKVRRDDAWKRWYDAQGHGYYR